MNIPRILLIAAVSAALPAAHAQRTTGGRLRPTMPETADIAAADTIQGAAADSLLVFSGYEKTLRASRETVFITNRSSRDVCTVVFTIGYLDAEGRQLHQRTVRQHIGLPAGETRRLDFPSWDTQRTTYYRHGPRPRTSAIPYTIKITEPKAITEP